MEALNNLSQLRKDINDHLNEHEPLLVVICSFLAAFVAYKLLFFFNRLKTQFEDKGVHAIVMSSLLAIIKLYPGMSTTIENEKQKVISKLQGSTLETKKHYRTVLPSVGYGDAVSEEIMRLHASDKTWQGKCSGTVYMGGPDYNTHLERVTFAYSMFSHTNPLHADIFPSIVKFESEVVAMTGSILGSQSENSGGQICGNMTSGGSESILMAVKTTRDYMRATKNITEPEMIIAESAHSAYDKAANYFGIRLRRAPVGQDLRADVRKMERLVNRNTIMIVGSAPGFPHGLIDPIESLGAMAVRRGICFHVDLCLGGFVLPFAKKLGYPIPPFGFEVPGVTSVSVDTHKYGLGPKGSSVVLYRNHEIRQHQFVAVTEWSGGLYISPSASGSRPGGLIAAAWASLVSLGESGFLEITRSVMDATKRIVEGIRQIEGLHVLGEPDMTIVAFGSHQVDIYRVNDVMTDRGWNLNALQKPASVHICVTLQHVNMVDCFLQDLSRAVRLVLENPTDSPDGMAPIYGAAAKVADRGLVKDLLVAYMDSTC